MYLIVVVSDTTMWKAEGFQQIGEPVSVPEREQARKSRERKITSLPDRGYARSWCMGVMVRTRMLMTMVGSPLLGREGD